MIKSWNQEYSIDTQPDMAQLEAYIATPLWNELRAYVEKTYEVQPHVEHSTCSGAPGWNVKYKKAGRSLCTLYPDRGYFTCLVCIGGAESVEAELLLNTCTDYVRELYSNVKPFNGARWLMIGVTNADVLADVKMLIGCRAKVKKKA